MRFFHNFATEQVVSMAFGGFFLRRLRFGGLIVLSVFVHASMMHGQTVDVDDSTAVEDEVKETLPSKIGRSLKDLSQLIFSNKITTDTAYVSRPVYPWTFKFRCDVKNNFIHYDYGKESGYMENNWGTLFGMGANYKGLSISLSGNPGKWFRWNEDNEISINLYNNRFGIDASYYVAKKLYGYDSYSSWFKNDNPLEYNDAITKGLSINVYYVFNNKRFSYPAAFSQTWIQKHSAGSFIVSATYCHRDITSNFGIKEEEYPEIDPEFVKDLSFGIHTRYLSLGCGYAYNYVPNRHWLIHLSAVPGVMVARDCNQSLKWEDDDLYTMDSRGKLDLTANVRSSVIYSWKNYFTGMTGIYSVDYAGKAKKSYLSYMRWKIRLVFGFRL